MQAYEKHQFVGFLLRVSVKKTDTQTGCQGRRITKWLKKTGDLDALIHSPPTAGEGRERGREPGTCWKIQSTYFVSAWN
jgi:hypothetical protein